MTTKSNKNAPEVSYCTDPGNLKVLCFHSAILLAVMLTVPISDAQSMQKQRVKPTPIY